MRQLSDAQYWKVIFPSFNEATGGLSADASTCTGEFLFKSTEFADAKPVRGWPLVPETTDLTFGAGPKRVKIVWFKTHTWPDGDVGGALALVRADEEYVEVYGVGTYKGDAKTSRFSVERLSGAMVITAIDEGCIGKDVKEPCENWLHVLVPWHGKLATQASIATERRLQVNEGEPATPGLVSYRLTAAALFEPTRIRLLEQVQGVDATERKLRTAELERQYDFVDGRLVERQPSLWERFVGDKLASASPKPVSVPNKAKSERTTDSQTTNNGSPSEPKPKVGDPSP
jgi:hypothetical protein